MVCRVPFEGLKAAFQCLKGGLSKFKGADLRVYRMRLKGALFQRIWAAQGPKRVLAIAKRRRLQANPRKSAAGPLFKGSRPLRGQKGVQQWQKEGVCKPILGNLLLDPFLKDLGRSGAKRGPAARKIIRVQNGPASSFLPDFGRWVAEKGPKKP